MNTSNRSKKKTVNASSLGRYITYSREIDAAQEAHIREIRAFEEAKIKDLLEENPFNLKCKRGIHLAQKEISGELASKISDLSSPLFEKLRMDRAAAILMGYVRANKAS